MQTNEESTEAANNAAGIISSENKKVQQQNILVSAEYMAKGYDYDGAIMFLEGQADYGSRQDYQQAVVRFREEKAKCVPVDVTKVPHIFYHSLVNEPSRTFNAEELGEDFAAGHQTWMVTAKEFDRVTQALYANGYVYVRMHDLVVEKIKEDGSVTLEENTNLMLPPGKKAIILSVDDLNYYHSYEQGGYPAKLIVDDNGKPKCIYTNSEGETHIGDYDVVPRLNSFLEAHPDGAYKGARGIIALTGYNGVFGYRTDTAYKTGERLDSDQKAWLESHPEFDWNAEVAEARAVARAIKNSGWEFASHTWGHISVTDRSVKELKTDDEKWKKTVENIVGKVDTIIFAHGNDIAGTEDYSENNKAFAYYKSTGYKFFCNVDSGRLYWNQFRSSYLRQARINIDGLTLKRAMNEPDDIVNTLFDAKSVYDEERPEFKAASGKE